MPGSRQRSKLMSIVRNALGDGEYLVSSRDTCQGPAERAAPYICHVSDAESTIDSLVDFSDALLQVPNVEAAAFLRVREPRCDTALQIEVLMPIVRGDATCEDAFDAVADAEAKLAARIESFFPSALSFVNTADTDLNEIRSSLRKRWESEKDTTFVALLIFDRQPVPGRD